MVPKNDKCQGTKPCHGQSRLALRFEVLGDKDGPGNERGQRPLFSVPPDVWRVSVLLLENGASEPQHFPFLMWELECMSRMSWLG